jgi:hypothetical protein
MPATARARADLVSAEAEHPRLPGHVPTDAEGGGAAG